MSARRALPLIVASLLVAGTASADLKVVEKQHTDGFTVMGRETPATEDEEVSWIGDDRTRRDSGDQTTILRLDTQKLYLVHHDDRTYNVLDLPVNLEQFMPPGMVEQMKAMMTFEVTVTPRDETKQIGEWKARRYDVALRSKMVNTDITMWATTDIDFDREAYLELYANLNSLNPGLAAMATEMAKVEGFVVAQESESKMPMMGDTTVTRREEVVSIEKLAPPAGTYDVPADYREVPFDFMASMQRQ